MAIGLSASLRSIAVTAYPTGLIRDPLDLARLIDCEPIVAPGANSVMEGLVATLS